MTPDLVYAEIGHGRGTGPSVISGAVMVPAPVRRSTEPTYVGPGAHNMPFGSSTYTAMATAAMAAAGPSTGIPNPFSEPTEVNHRPHIPFNDVSMEDSSGQTSASSSEGNNERGHQLTDSTNSYQRSPPRTDLSESWTTVHHENLRAHSTSPTTRELQESVESALGQQGGYMDVDGRGRSGKRSSRNPGSAAEQYASTFFFGRGSTTGSTHDVTGGPSSNPRDSDPHGH